MRLSNNAKRAANESEKDLQCLASMLHGGDILHGYISQQEVGLKRQATYTSPDWQRTGLLFNKSCAQSRIIRASKKVRMSDSFILPSDAYFTSPKPNAEANTLTNRKGRGTGQYKKSINECSEMSLLKEASCKHKRCYYTCSTKQNYYI